MDYKIIQIIPNNTPMVAEFRDGEEIFENPIVMFALIEYESGERSVVSMDIDEETGEAGPVNDLDNFIGTRYL